MFFDSSNHFDVFVNSTFEKSDFPKINDHFVNNDYLLREGTFLIRVINITQEDADRIIGLGANLYIDTTEFEIDIVGTQYSVFKDEPKELVDFFQTCKHKIMRDLVKMLDNNEQISSFIKEYGSITEKYLIDIFIGDIESAEIAINYFLKK